MTRTASPRRGLFLAPRDVVVSQIPNARPPVAEMGFANLDLDRARRCGFPEVVYGPGKTVEQLEAIVARLIAAGQDCLVTRLDDAPAARLRDLYPAAQHDRLARTFFHAVRPAGQPMGRVAVVTAGTGDLPVAQEAAVTARALGCEVDVIADAGVAGLHRLLARLPEIQRADVVVCVAGMDGALPSVVGGLVGVP
ncbi:MAG: nickel pincer cofactor biosynthesis protein LarB, partial [Gemmataceae bacterium]|nr:nickel pincer cofactor biosynthesis protein LarB [Gemmataceae bacterium]